MEVQPQSTLTANRSTSGSSTAPPARQASLFDAIASDAETFTCRNAMDKIKPTYSRSSAKTALKGSDIFKRYNKAVFMVFGASSDGAQVWQGSGFFINSNGLAISNCHNFEDATDIGIKFYDSDDFHLITKENILAYNKGEDYIIFKVDGQVNNPYIPIANKRSEIGDKVYTIGSPKGLENTFSSGEISQYRTEAGFIQITAPIDHGSSGGALMNEYGEAIGITSAGRDDSGANLNFCRDLLYILNRYK